MKAWLLPAFTGIEAMHLGEAADPVPGAGEVVMALRFAALNPADRYLAMGQYPAKPPLPHILGRDGVGTVTAVGTGVQDIQVGDTRLILRSEVGVNRAGTLAERVAVEARYTVAVPAGWTLEQAAAAPLVYVTAWQALTQWKDLPEKGVVLITGATGGVGVAATQLGQALGHTVVGLSRSAEKSAELRKLGASYTFDPQDKTWRKGLKETLGTRRVDLAIDNIGGSLFNEVIDTLGANGRVSCVGRLAGPVPEFNTAALFFRRLQIRGVAIATYSHEESVAAWEGILGTLGRTGARPVIDQVFGFGEVPAAFARLERGPMGKVLVAIS
ncbi:MAG TPA: zinc-binding alcohol dehydrogenase family protein [Phycisphaerae bacterium]|nr:zinc-binding alcohol dehydrogenase family protein [Phycisphaerae bacterium]